MKGAMLDVADICRLQGFSSSLIRWRDHMTDRKFMMHVGNAMSANILDHLFPAALRSAGLVNEQKYREIVDTLGKLSY